MTACDPDTGLDMNFFTRGIGLDDDIDSYFDKFERLSVIYVSRNLMMMYFKDNTFFMNTGTFGGAITINSPNFSTNDRPFLVIQTCTFTNN